MAIKELFNPEYLANKIKEKNTSLVISKEQKETLNRWYNQLQEEKNETQLQSDFLNDISLARYWVIPQKRVSRL